MAASLSNHPSSFSAPPPLPPSEEISSVISLQALELSRFHHEKKDSQISQLDRNQIVDDLRVRSHDEKFAHEIDLMPEEEWEDWGDEFVLKISKPLPSVVNCREAVEVEALIEAFDAVVGLGVKKNDVLVDYRAL